MDWAIRPKTPLLIAPEEAYLYLSFVASISGGGKTEITRLHGQIFANDIPFGKESVCLCSTQNLYGTRGENGFNDKVISGELVL